MLPRPVPEQAQPAPAIENTPRDAELYAEVLRALMDEDGHMSNAPEELMPLPDGTLPDSPSGLQWTRATFSGFYAPEAAQLTRLIKVVDRVLRRRGRGLDRLPR